MESGQQSKGQTSDPGKIITFYSYKGGTGRTMALANVACLLAQNSMGNRGILVVDWDLEAPGLHRFFRDRLSREFGSGPDVDAKLDAHPGLIDLFFNLNERVQAFQPGLEEPNEEIESALRKAANLDDVILKTDIPSLHLLKAGRFDDEYPARINSFSWVDLYDDYAWLFPLFSDWLAERYEYILIDSRTGDTDTSNICTMIMPEKLVAVFTPNNQSLLGVLRILRRAFKYRGSSDVRPLMVYPLPSRIDADEPARRESWRYGDSESGIPGYQPEFEKLFTEVYQLDECSLEKYLKEVQIQHTSRYAYGEEIAVLIERGRDRLSLSYAFEVFTNRLISPIDPWEEESKAEAETEAGLVVQRAERAFARLTPNEQAVAREVFTRLVRLPPPGEGGKPTALQISVEEFSTPARKLLDSFTEDRVIKKVKDSDTGKEMVSIEKDELISRWRRLKDWLEEDTDFLLWRQQLRSSLTEWVNAERSKRRLLRGEGFAKAKKQLTGLKQNFSPLEEEFIRKSEARSVLIKRAKFSGAIAGVLMMIFLADIGLRQYRAYQIVQQTKRDLVQWGLPDDLYEYQNQLNSLSVINDLITNTDWIKGDLKELRLNSKGIRNIGALPASITSLRLNGTELISLDGIEKLTNLTQLSLDIRGGLLINLEPLSKLTNLTQLSLFIGEGQVISLEPLSKLTNLTHLSLLIRGEQVSSLEPLSKLTNLTILDLSDTKLNSLEGIEKFANLTSLDLSSTGLTSLAELEKCANLKTLDISGLKLTTLKGLPKSVNNLSL